MTHATLILSSQPKVSSTITQIFLCVIAACQYNHRMIDQEMNKQILDYLARHVQASSRELSHDLGITKSGVRYHLAILARQGSIEVVPSGEIRQDSPGRPRRYFRLKEDGRSNHLSELISILMNQFEPEQAVSRQAFYNALAQAMLPKSQQVASLNAHHLNLLIDFLNERHYSARWEAHRNGPRIVFQTCPYARIWPDHPSICILDRRIIALWTGADVQQTANMNETREAGNLCIFEVETRRQSSS